MAITGERRGRTEWGRVVGEGAGNGAGAGSGSGAGGESITFADVKVGDAVAGKGALKNGVFVPTELGVLDAAAAAEAKA